MHIFGYLDVFVLHPHCPKDMINLDIGLSSVFFLPIPLIKKDTYILLDISSSHKFVSRDVQFYEEHIPYKKTNMPSDTFMFPNLSTFIDEIQGTSTMLHND